MIFIRAENHEGSDACYKYGNNNSSHKHFSLKLSQYREYRENRHIKNDHCDPEDHGKVCFSFVLLFIHMGFIMSYYAKIKNGFSEENPFEQYLN